MKDSHLDQLANIANDSGMSLAQSEHLELLALDIEKCAREPLIIALNDLLSASECKELPSPNWVLAAQLQAKALLKALEKE